jgi:hypothetical protein
MKVELHCHTSEFSACAPATAAELLTAMIAKGYDAVYLTEHDVVWPPDALAALQARFPAIRIFPGVEVTLATGRFQHLVVLGTHDPAYVAMADAPEALLERARAEGHLTFFAHSFRTETSHELLDRGIFADALEWASGNQHHEKMAMAYRLAAEHGLPLVNAGDSHAVEGLDRQWIETHRDIVEADDIRGIVLDRAYDLLLRQPGAET